MPTSSGSAPLSLYDPLDPTVLADPYPLYGRLRRDDPVHWDPYPHAWVSTRYTDELQVIQTMSAECTPSPGDAGRARQILLTTLLRRPQELRLTPASIAWRPNLRLRGLIALPAEFRT